MSEKPNKNPLKEIVGKENPSTLIKFTLAVIGILGTVSTGVLYAPIDSKIKLIIACSFYGIMIYLILKTYNDASKNPLKYIANSTTLIQFLSQGLGDSYKDFTNQNQIYESNSNALIENDSQEPVKLIKPKKISNKLITNGQ